MKELNCSCLYNFCGGQPCQSILLVFVSLMRMMHSGFQKLSQQLLLLYLLLGAVYHIVGEQKMNVIATKPFTVTVMGFLTLVTSTVPICKIWICFSGQVCHVAGLALSLFKFLEEMTESVYGFMCHLKNRNQLPLTGWRCPTHLIYRCLFSSFCMLMGRTLRSSWCSKAWFHACYLGLAAAVETHFLVNSRDIRACVDTARVWMYKRTSTWRRKDNCLSKTWVLWDVSSKCISFTRLFYLFYQFCILIKPKQELTILQ